MYKRFFSHLRRTSVNRLLVPVWFLGLMMGTLSAAGMDLSFHTWMHRAFSQPVSIVILLIAAVLPFLISAYAVWIKRHEILLGVLFCKAFGFAFLAFSASVTFGNAGWLLQPMICFPDIVLMPFLCWFCFRSNHRNESNLFHDHAICLFSAVCSVLIHYFVVLPFLAGLID